MIADIEIRLLPLAEQGYPVEIRVTTDTGEQQFPRRYAAAALPTLSSTTNHTAPGEQLWQWFMADPDLRQDWARLSGQHPQRRLRLRLDAAAPELHPLPWEQIHDGHSHLAASDNTPFSRYLAGPWRPQPPITADPVRVLVAIANPDNLERYGLQPVEVEKEWALLNAAAADPRFELIQLTAPITLARLETALRDGVHILHLVGHGQMTRNGENALLYLADENNQVQPVRDSEFVAMLTRLLGGVDTVATAHLRLVYLSSCQTASRNPADAFRGLAPQLVQAGITSVVAMQELVPVVTAQAFARTFYEQLAQHGQVDAAANRARAHILTAKLPGAAIPVLFSRLRNNQLLHDPLAAGEESEAGLVMTINSEGGDVIAGDKHIHGDEVHGDKVGEDKVEGDKITVGNITGSQGIAIGRGTRADVRIQYSPTGDELAPLFAPLLAQAARENGTVVAQLQALKAEVAKGENADDDNMADLIGDIARAAPAVVEGLVNLFTSTMVAKVAGGATKYILRRLRK